MNSASGGFTHFKMVLSLCLIVVLSGSMVAFFDYIQQRSTDNRSQASELRDSFVTASGNKFYLGGKEFKFVGFNLFDAVGSGNSPYSCVQTNGWWTRFSNGELNDAMRTMKTDSGATVLRFWAYQKYTKGGTDYSGIDNVIQLAKINGFKVLPVLDDGPGYCTEPGGGGNSHIAKWQYQNDSWYTDGYKTVTSGNTLSYRDYVKAIVTRYKDDPTIFGWMLMNEADTSKKITVNGKQESDLVGFATDMGSVVKSADPNHLLTVGTQSNGASGATGQDFIDVYSVPTIDFADGHDWGYWGGDTMPLPGATADANGNVVLPDPMSATCLKTYQGNIGCSLSQAVNIIHKPMIFSESGIAATDAPTRQRRADLMDKKMNAFFANQGAGYLYWQWNKILDAEHFDVLANTQDPLLPIMKKYAGLVIVPPADTVITPTPVASTQPVASPTLKPTSVPTAAPTIQPTLQPTVKPTATPTLKPTSSPTTIPTIKPTVAPTNRPTPRPTPIPVPPTGSSSILDGIRMMFTSGSGKVVTDSQATSGQALLLETNSDVVGNIQGPMTLLTLRLKPDKCLGSPHVNVKVNGQYVLDANIDKDGYQDYTSNSLAYLNLGSHTYTVEVIYGNDAAFPFCNRNVTIDRITAH